MKRVHDIGAHGVPRLVYCELPQRGPDCFVVGAALPPVTAAADEFGNFVISSIE